jgi:hypothetical protein
VHTHDRFFHELQLLGYGAHCAGKFSWQDFEKLMVKIRKVKSYVFEDNGQTTVGDFHEGAFIDATTAEIAFTNHRLSDVASEMQITTSTDTRNEISWKIKTTDGQTIDLREHWHIVLNASGAPAADAVLCYDSEPCRN